MALPTELRTREMAKFTEPDEGGVGAKVKIVDAAEVQYSWKYILTADEFNVKESAGYLKRIVINKPLANGTISLFNNGSGASVAMGVITLPGTLLSDGPNSVDYDLAFTSGLTIVTTEAQDITVIYK